MGLSLERGNLLRRRALQATEPHLKRSYLLGKEDETGGREADAARRIAVLSAVLIHAVADQIGDDGGIGQRGRIAEIGEVVLGDLAQDAPHDFAGPGFG